MANNIELITNYSPKYWDLVYRQESVTSVLDANPKLVKFTGAKTVKIGKFSAGGLSNYYRNNNANDYGDARVPAAPAGTEFVGAADFGYQPSPAGLTWEEFTLACDRAASFQIEYFDNEESGEELVGLGVTEISRTKIVPEVDAYCLSKIAGYALPAAKVQEDITTAPLAALNRAFVYFDNNEVPADDQVVFCSPAFMNALRNTNEVTKFLTQEDFNAAKDIKFRIEKYEGRTLIVVSPERLRTEIRLINGGYRWATNAVDNVDSTAINFLMVAKSAVMHVVKYEKVRVIGGETNLAARGFDGYTIFARIYHDVFVPDNKRVAIYMSYPQTAVAAPSVALAVTKKDNKVESITVQPGSVMSYVGYITTADAATAVSGSSVTDMSKFHIVGPGTSVANITGSFYAVNNVHYDSTTSKTVATILASQAI